MFSVWSKNEGRVPNICLAMWRNADRSHSLFVYCCLAPDVRFSFKVALKPFRPLWRCLVRAAPTCTLWERDWRCDRLVFRPWRAISISALELYSLGARFP